MARRRRTGLYQRKDGLGGSFAEKQPNDRHNYTQVTETHGVASISNKFSHRRRQTRLFLVNSLRLLLSFQDLPVPLDSYTIIDRQHVI